MSQSVECRNRECRNRQNVEIGMNVTIGCFGCRLFPLAEQIDALVDRNYRRLGYGDGGRRFALLLAARRSRRT